jgi:uncharacterized protein YegP (UPF0339 family)
MKFEVWKSTASNQWFWRLRAANNRLIASSGGGYADKGDCLQGIKLIVGTSSETPIIYL